MTRMAVKCYLPIVIFILCYSKVIWNDGMRWNGGVFGEGEKKWILICLSFRHYSVIPSSFWPNSPPFLSHSIQIRSSLSELDWNELGWDWMRSEWFNQVLMDGHFRIKVKPLDFFFEVLSTNQRPRFWALDQYEAPILTVSFCELNFNHSHPVLIPSFHHHSVIQKSSWV